MKRNKPFSSIFGAVCLAMAMCLAALIGPQQTWGDDPTSHLKPYALIFGTVWDPVGAPMYGVKVKIRPADAKKAKWELYSDHRGEFAQRVPAGSHDYIVSTEIKPQKGQPRLEAAEVRVHIENDERQDVGVHLKKAAAH